MSDLDRATAVARKLSAKAEDALAGIEREMILMEWPAEFQKMIWLAISSLAIAKAMKGTETKQNPDMSRSGGHLTD